MLVALFIAALIWNLGTSESENLLVRLVSPVSDLGQLFQSAGNLAMGLVEPARSRRRCAKKPQF